MFYFNCKIFFATFKEKIKLWNYNCIFLEARCENTDYFPCKWNTWPKVYDSHFAGMNTLKILITLWRSPSLFTEHIPHLVRLGWG